MATTVSKLAFIGWGIGIPDIDFTGISGHTMLAMAVYPLLFSTLASQLPPLQQRLSVAAGFVLALLVGQSRLEIDVHSVSEVLAGAMVGAAVSLFALLKNSMPREISSPWLAVVFCGFFGASLSSTSQVNPHSWVTEFALMLSGTSTPYTRATVKRLQVLKLQPFQTSQPVPISFYAAVAFHPPRPNLPASW
ncbi:MAG: phosphatase PAP2 family protein [Polaromonas sp.]|nr:phosphatase PAP2 family protein [Polaromonas sp.]